MPMPMPIPLLSIVGGVPFCYPGAGGVVIVYEEEL